MITKAQAKTLKTLWASWRYGPCQRSHDCQKLIGLAMAETRDHRRFMGSRYGLTMTQEARFFALLRLGKFALDSTTAREPIPDPAKFFYYQHSVYGAYALCNDGGTQEYVRDWAESVRPMLAELITWDYSDLAA